MKKAQATNSFTCFESSAGDGPRERSQGHRDPHRIRESSDGEGAATLQKKTPKWCKEWRNTRLAEELSFYSYCIYFSKKRMIK